MKLTRVLCLFVFIVSLSTMPAFGQTTATGVPPFTSMSGGPDQVNLANLNVHQVIPVLHKAGRGLPLIFDITYDTTIWYQLQGSGGQMYWAPLPTAGWSQSPANVGMLDYSYTFDNLGDVFYSGFTYYDGGGTPHELSPDSAGCGNGAACYLNCADWNPCGSISTNGVTAFDDSGYTLNATVDPSTHNLVVGLFTANGTAIVPQNFNPTAPGASSGSTYDRNGNEITISNGTITDTLGTTALQISGGIAPDRSETPQTFTYTAPSGSQAAVTVNYESATIDTNFQCSNVVDYVQPSGIPNYLVSSIVLPDGSSYQFHYEDTPGIPGATTGRLTSVILPTGGTISYQYTGSNNGINCSDGSPLGLTRTTPDGTWTYTRSFGSGLSTTNVTDPQGNVTAIQFAGLYETERQVYNGTQVPAHLLLTTYDCYNNNKPQQASCASGVPPSGSFVLLPITERSVFVQLPSGQESEQDMIYNPLGLETQETDYDYGSNSPGVPLRQSAVVYHNFGSGSQINNLPDSVTVTDGSGNIDAQTTYVYDASTPAASSGTPQHVTITGPRGNATTIARLAQGTSTLAETFTYFDTGQVNKATDVNGTYSIYNYPDATSTCGNAFPTFLNEPNGLTESFAWNCTGGVLASRTDANGKVQSVSYNDPYFWRPHSITDQMSNITTLTYIGQNAVESSLPVNGSSTVDQLTTLDSLGRSQILQTKEAPASTNYDSVQDHYDSLGRLSGATVPYSAAGSQLCSGTCPSTSIQQDALSRPTSIADAGGATLSIQYPYNDVYESLGPKPTGENTKDKQLEYDALGRLKSVCEISSTLPGVGTCAQSSSATGYWTRYTYDALNRLTSVTQNAQSSTPQTRSYVYDDLGRMTSETNPESGTTTYYYDNGCGHAFTGDLDEKIDANGQTTCYFYDDVHRLNTLWTSQSGGHCAHFTYDSSVGIMGSTPPGISVSNLAGHLVEADTDDCNWPLTQSDIITDEWFGYDARGEVSDFYESTPNSGGYYHANQTYWPNGAPMQLSGVVSLPNISYGVDSEGRVNTVFASLGQNLTCPKSLRTRSYNALRAFRFKNLVV